MSEQAVTLSQEVASLVSRAVEKAVTALPAFSSPEIDQIAAALAVAQAKMFSPARNKFVSVKSKRTQETYDWRYASLDVINDMIREPLAESGLSHMHLMRPNRHGELFMYTRLQHKSGQYIDSVIPLTAAIAAMADERGPGWQSFGSAVSYCKRYNLSALLGIASQEDDDANVAEGNDVIDHGQPLDPGMAVRVLHDRYARLVAAASGARDPASVGEVMQRWQKGMRFWMRMRDQPGYGEHWARLLRLIPEALRRVHGPTISAAWETGARARTMDQVATLRVLWESDEAKIERGKMKEQNAISYGMLFEHLRLQAARVEREIEEAERRERMEAVRQEQLQYAIEEIETEPSPFDRGVGLSPADVAAAGEAEDGQALPPAAAPPAELEDELGGTGDDETASHRQLRDEVGELMSDTYGEKHQAQFALELVDLYERADNRRAVIEHNADGLAWARLDPEAAAILMLGIGPSVWGEATTEPADQAATAELPDQAAAPPAPEPVMSIAAPSTEAAKADLPAEEQLSLLPLQAGESWRVVLTMNGRGKPDVQGFVRAVRISLDRTGPDDLDDWIETNRATIRSLPGSIQTTVAGMLTQRRMVLGVEQAA